MHDELDVADSVVEQEMAGKISETASIFRNCTELTLTTTSPPAYMPPGVMALVEKKIARKAWTDLEG